MGNIGETFSESNQFGEGIYPSNLVPSIYVTPWMSWADIERGAAIVAIGGMGAGAIVNFELDEASDAAGTGVTALWFKNITPLQGGVDPDNQLIIINLRADELSDGFSYVRGVLTIAVANVDAAVILLGDVLNYSPAVTAGIISEVVN